VSGSLSDGLARAEAHADQHGPPPPGGVGPPAAAPGSGGGSSQVRRLLTYIVAEALAVAVGYAVTTLREGPPRGLSDWGLVLGGAVAVAVPLYVKSRRELRQDAATRSAEALAIEMDTKLHLILGDVITPIAEVVGRIHQAGGEPERSSLRGQLKQLVVEAVAHLCGTERTRAIFFELRGRTMRPEAWTGRADPPHTVFTDQFGDRRGQEALLLVEHHDFLMVHDVDSEAVPPGVQARPGSQYRSFISIAVFCGDQDFGMLTVDAPEARAFDETDLNVMRAMAQLLGTGLVERHGTLSRLWSGS
jgi:GAF domain-containing protein